jgi:addiction module RelE/StbE family toxin
MSIKWTRTALRNLDEVAGYIANDNPVRATTFVLALRNSVNKLQDHPGLGRAGRVHGTRELILHKNYIAIYRLRGSDIEILRLHHVAQKI